MDVKNNNNASPEQQGVYTVISDGVTWRHYLDRSVNDCQLQPAKMYRFFSVSQAIAGLSRDPSSKVGCLIFGSGYEIRASGWNGAPRGCQADTDERYETRDEKLWWAAHAELNAIANAARTGTPLEGCAMLSTHFPCMGCAKAIVQAGIRMVVCPEPDAGFAERWAEDIFRTTHLFGECGVRIVTFTENEK